MPRPGAARLHRLLRHGRRVLQLEKARIVTYYGLIPLIVFLGDELAYDMYTSAAFSWCVLPGVKTEPRPTLIQLLLPV